MTKKQKIIDYLQNTNNGITSLEAINMFGATRLSAIIFELKDKGYIIKDRYEEGFDRFGNECRFKRYWIVGSIHGE